MSTIESSVTRLLVSTKHLLESLTQWARQKADDKFVSDAYVKLGNDFRAATRAFTNAGVDISDLGDVPKALRIVLESALSEAPTQENLDRFLPNIRNIIVNLLLSLKAKQLKAKEISDEKLKKAGSSTTGAKQLSLLQTSEASGASLKDSEQKGESQTSIHVAPPNEEHSSIENESSSMKQTSTVSNDALAKLQKGNFILRRASKRFSAYQFAKLTNLNNQLPRIASDTAKSADSSFDDRFKPATASAHSSKAEPSDSIHIFMRLGEHTKKVNVLLPLTIASLRLQFVEKFAYSPGASVFPEIYILDQQSNVWFELEDSSIERDIKEGSLLSLKGTMNGNSVDREFDSKVEILQEQFEAFSAKLTSEMKDLIGAITPSISIPQHVSNSETEDKTQQVKRSELFNEILQEIKEIQAVSETKKKVVESSVKELSLEIEALKSAGCTEGDNSSNRHFMQSSYTRLSEDSDNLLTKVDDLQDMMEALRKDVAQRGVRLGAKQLKSTRKEIEEVSQLLSTLTSFIADGKSTWKRIWEAELDKVCEEQQFFNLQDDLTADLKEDIKKIQETFDLIEKCSVEQSKQISSRKAKFSGLIHLQEPGETLHNLRDAVLNQVSSLVPNHESRLEAIAKAEKLRKKEREITDISQFQEELGDFVEDNKFKTSGGIEELERRRRQKDSENLKLSFGIV